MFIGFNIMQEQLLSLIKKYNSKKISIFIYMHTNLLSSPCLFTFHYYSFLFLVIINIIVHVNNKR